MKRRTFLFGVGGSVAGSGALIGSGAFTSGQLSDRDATIPVAADSEGAVQLRSGHDMVRENPETHRLEIDFQKFEEQDYAGANVGAQFWIGDTSNPKDNHAFRMKNHSASDLDVTFEYTVDEPSDSKLSFIICDENGQITTYTAPNGTVTFPMADGEKRYVVLKVDSRDGIPEADLTGSLTINAVGT